MTIEINETKCSFPSFLLFRRKEAISAALPLLGPLVFEENLITGQGVISTVLEHTIESGPWKASHVSWDTFLNQRDFLLQISLT